MLRCEVCHAQSSPHRVRIQRQVHPFQLMTSARETARAATGRAKPSIGISKVPDARLDRLTAMYNPRKRVPATVEFSDLGGRRPDGRRAGARRCRGVQERRRARARRCGRSTIRPFRIPPGSVDPARDAQAMEDELILADLGVAERRLERLEKDLKKSRTTELERERDVLDAVPRGARGRPAAARARSEGRGSQAAARLSVPVRQAAAASSSISTKRS